MITLKEFGARMEDIRKLSGVKNAQIAERLGISEQAVSYIQKGRGKTLPGKEQIEIIAEMIGTTYDILMGANEEILGRYTPEEQELLMLGESTQYVKLALAKMRQDLENSHKLKNYNG